MCRKQQENQTGPLLLALTYVFFNIYIYFNQLQLLSAFSQFYSQIVWPTKPLLPRLTFYYNNVIFLVGIISSIWV